MIIKGFIFFKDNKIPFVIENYKMELFSDNLFIRDFCKEYNFKENYILQGQCVSSGDICRKAIFLVEKSLGTECYLSCYIINMHNSDEVYNSIGLQSPFLDDVFRYKYQYFDTIKSDVNLAISPKNLYTIPFSMNKLKYELKYQIGHDSRLGILEDFDRKGEIIVPLHTNGIQECYDIAMVLYRLAMFMMSRVEVPFKQIILYNNGHRVGWFYCSLLSENAFSGRDMSFFKFDVLKYIPKILNNIALDSRSKITQSIPLGHLGNFENLFSPQRFIEQVMSFEYLFDKLDHKNAQNKRYPLKMELETMFNEFSQLLLKSKLSSNKISDEIKELRRNISHGYVYYYDFNNNQRIKHLIVLLDRLIKCMSLKYIGFSIEEIYELFNNGCMM